MMRWFREFLSSWRFCVFSALCLGAAFSAKGAAIESKIKASADPVPLTGTPGVDYPVMQGVMSLAATRNHWLSYRYATIGMLLGLAAGLAVVAVCRYMMKKRKSQRDPSSEDS